MGALFEPLLLYMVLFLPGAVSYSPPPDAAAFSAERELIRILVYNIPSFTLIWYLLLRKKSIKEWGISLPGKKDLFTVLWAFPGLLLIGLTISVVSSFFAGIPAGAAPAAPGSLPGWVIMILSCVSTGYLEESFFRFYLLAGLRGGGTRNPGASSPERNFTAWAGAVPRYENRFYGFFRGVFNRGRDGRRGLPGKGGLPGKLCLPWDMDHRLPAGAGRPVSLSVLLFALCHVYEGPWGVLNAVLAGTLLAVVFLHFKSLHGIALAHGLYNAFVYALGV